MEAKLVPIDLLVPSNRNPRARTKPDPALVASVRALGIIEPIVVRPLPDGTYEILAGERRYRAALEAGLSEVPVVVREAGNREALEVALAENVARKDLNAFEAMEGVLRTIEEAGFSQEEAVMILKRALHSLRRTRGEEAPEVEVVRKILEPTGISPYSLIRYEPLLNIPREVRRCKQLKNNAPYFTLTLKRFRFSAPHSSKFLRRKGHRRVYSLPGGPR